MDGAATTLVTGDMADGVLAFTVVGRADSELISTGTAVAGQITSRYVSALRGIR